MQNMIKSGLIGLMIICFAFNSHGTARAENIQEISPETLAVTLVIDMSDSMNTTDPQKLRETAANIFIDLLSPEDYLGIIVFNDSYVTVQPIQKISGPENKNAIKSKLAPYILASGWTDYKVALDGAYNMLSTVNDANARKIVVFLTDGAPSFPTENVPGAMNAYLETLWGTVNTYAVHKIPIYSIGFSDNVKTEILKRISSDTSGDFKIINDQSSLAKSFYETLATLKNRESIMDATLILGSQTGIDFYLDEYTTQITIVIANKEGASYDVSLQNPKGQNASSSASINKTAKYTIVTINNQDSNNYGSWRLGLKGTGSVDVFGDKDMTFKSWVVSPNNLSMHALNEPIEIEVSVTGAYQEGISVTAVVEGAGQSGPEEVKLTRTTGNYKGSYNKTSVQGSYTVTINVYLNDEIITTTKETINVRLIPALTCDFYVSDIGYRVGEKAGMTSSLNIRGIRLIQGNSLKVTNYSVLINNDDGTSELVPLLDNGKSENNDILADDGLWSGWINFSKKSVSDMSLIVTGTYNNENFVIEKKLGKYSILNPGKITFSGKAGDLVGRSGKKLSVPVVIENDSDFTEIIYAEMDPSFGSIEKNKIVLEPHTKNTYEIVVKINDNIEPGEYDFHFTFKAENELTVITNNKFMRHFEIVSWFKYNLSSVSDFYSHYYEIISVSVLLPVTIILILLLMYLVGGVVFYKTIFLKRGEVSGILKYDLKTVANPDKMKNSIDIGMKNKRKIVLHIGKSQNEYDFIIRNTVYNYDLIITTLQERKYSVCTTGWISLLKRSEYIPYEVTAAPPGILEKNKEISTHLIIRDGDIFESADYIFRYFVDQERYSLKKNHGRDILMGKDQN